MKTNRFLSLGTVSFLFAASSALGAAPGASSVGATDASPSLVRDVVAPLAGNLQDQSRLGNASVFSGVEKKTAAEASFRQSQLSLLEKDLVKLQSEAETARHSLDQARKAAGLSKEEASRAASALAEARKATEAASAVERDARRAARKASGLEAKAAEANAEDAAKAVAAARARETAAKETADKADKASRTADKAVDSAREVAEGKESDIRRLSSRIDAMKKRIAEDQVRAEAAAKKAAEEKALVYRPKSP